MFGVIGIPIIGIFFFSAWLAMVFWGMWSPEFGIATISYPKAMLFTIGLWLVVFPVTWAGRGGRRHVWKWRRRHGGAYSSSPNDDVDVVVAFAGSSRKVTSTNFRGGTVTAVFGGAELDLRNAVVEERPAHLDVTAVFGGVDVKVPSDWRVEIDASAVFGGTADERKQGVASEGEPHLVISGTAVFGGISVKD